MDTLRNYVFASLECVAILSCASAPARAQEDVELPGINVDTTRLVRGANGPSSRERSPGTAPGPSTPDPPATAAGTSGPGGIVTGTIITGASSTVITSADIERSPGATLTDILGREAGISVRSLFGTVNGAQTTVDMRGFGATGTNNTLVLINGRRINDIDLAGVEFSSIPPNSIDRIEITRGNSGAVLYGDGAVGGVINIVTKAGVDLPMAARFEGAYGSYGYKEVKASVSGPAGPYFWVGAHAHDIDSDGYRQNNRFDQMSGVGEVRWTDRQGTSAYFTITADDQSLGLPGGRLVTPTSSAVATDPRGADTPRNFANKQGMSATAGITRVLWAGTELIVDGGVRQKNQQAAFFCEFCPDFDRGFDATLTTFSLTPRISSQHSLGSMPGKLLAGIDFYDSTYGSDRSQHLGDPPIHRYDLTQQTLAGYFQETIGLLRTTDLAFGLRVQGNRTTAQDRLDVTAPGGSIPFAPPTPQGDPLDASEVQYAAHIGLEHRFNEYFAVFGRAARSFRLPTVDERVGMAPFGVPTNFDLKAQTSHDVEGGMRLRYRNFTFQSSVYDMELKNELFFSPATFTNTNLDPTRRYGVENIATWQVWSNLRLKGTVSYTRSIFTEGPFAGNDVPLVSRWTGSAGLSWDIYQRYLVFDAVARFFGPSRMDNDASNLQVQIPGHALVDVRIGGQVDRFFWSASVQNIFDVHYFEYAVSAISFVTGLPDFGRYSAYPLPGRTVLLKAGLTW